jgi:hypothetical protein
MGVVGRLDQYASMLAWEFDETTANGPTITGLGTYYATEFNENIVDIVRDGLVLNLDAGNLASYPGSGTTWTDVSGSNYTHTLTSATFTTIDGVSCFNTSTTGRATNSATTFTFGSSHTMIAWARPLADSQVGTWRTLWRTQPNDHPLLIQDATNLIGYYDNDTNAFVSYGLNLGTLGLENKWTMFSLVASGGTTTLYINNGSSTGSVAYTASGMSHNAFGNEASGTQPFGYVSVAQLYNRALSADEISQNYNALATRYGLATTNSTAPMLANVFSPYDLVYDEFGGTLFGAGQGRYMRQNTDKSVIVYNEIDEVTDFYGGSIIRDGLVLNLDAGNTSSYSGSGTTWNDISGNGRNFTWISTPTFTSNGSASYFSTLGNRCTGPASNSFGIDNTSGYTIFLVSKQNALAQSSAFKFYGSVALNRGIFSHCTWDDNVIYFDQGGSTPPGSRTSVASGGSTTWNIWTFRRLTNSSERSISKNGSTLTTNTAGAANIDLNSTGANLGGSDEGSTWNAQLNSFIVYNRGLSDGEITQNFDALRNRFGL